MFLNKLKETNPELIKFAMELLNRHEILPDTYVLDLDTIVENGKKMLAISKPLKIKMWFMLKQVGRNPIIAKKLMDIGFDGVVAVDYKEALLMVRHHIPLGNVGHLVQIPQGALKTILASRPEVVTVYTYEKILEIDKVAGEIGIRQPLLFRVSDADSLQYSGQVAGFHTSNLKEVLTKVAKLKNVSFGGLTVFPALLYSQDEHRIEITANIQALNRAEKIAKEMGFQDYIVNIPSCTCCSSLPLISSFGGNSAEPGHGLTGTTPIHKYSDQPERIGYVYVSEISHNYDGKFFCYGGGEYRRGHLENCLVGKTLEQAKMAAIKFPDIDSIDYHFELQGEHPIGDPVLMCFRTQIFTTRSQVALVTGLATGKPELLEIDTPFGEKAVKDWI